MRDLWLAAVLPLLAGALPAGTLLAGAVPGRAEVAAAAASAREAARVLIAELAAGEHRGVTGFAFASGGEAPVSFESAEVVRRGADIRSATKAITALLVGIAIDRGLLSGTDALVVELLPELREAFSSDRRKLAMRVEDLLTMRSGLERDDWNPRSPGHEDEMYRSRDWLSFWASRPAAAEPGAAFSYCTGNVIALGRILAHAAGEDVEAFAAHALFAPLGIEAARWARWNGGTDVDTGGHLRLRPRDMLAVGQLVLGGGARAGRQVVSRAWLARMTAVHTSIPGRPQRYGYLWWVDETRSESLLGRLPIRAPRRSGRDGLIADRPLESSPGRMQGRAPGNGARPVARLSGRSGSSPAAPFAARG